MILLAEKFQEMGYKFLQVETDFDAVVSANTALAMSSHYLSIWVGR